MIDGQSDNIVPNSHRVGRDVRTFDAGVRSTFALLRRSTDHTLSWLALGGLTMLPIGRATMTALSGPHVAANPVPSLLGFTLLGFAAASVCGAVAVTLDATRNQGLQRVRRPDAWHVGALVASSAIALRSLALVIVGGAVLGLVIRVALALFFALAAVVAYLILGLLFLGITALFIPMLRDVIAGIVAFVLGWISAGIRLLLGWILDRLLDSFRGRTRRPIVRGASSHFNKDGRPKIPYATETAAREAADDYFADRGSRMNAYRCEQGAHWHIGHAD